MKTPQSDRASNTTRIEAERLIALACDMLDAKRDQIAHDHLVLALDALQFSREEQARALRQPTSDREVVEPEGDEAASCRSVSRQPADSH